MKARSFLIIVIFLFSFLSASPLCFTNYTLPVSQYESQIVSYFISDSDYLFICYRDSNVKVFNLQTNFLISQENFSTISQKVVFFHKLSHNQDIFLIIYEDLASEIRSFRASWILENEFRLSELPSHVFSNEINEFFYLVKKSYLQI
jgi:hypothetical protein